MNMLYDVLLKKKKKGCSLPIFCKTDVQLVIIMISSKFYTLDILVISLNMDKFKCEHFK